MEIFNLILKANELFGMYDDIGSEVFKDVLKKGHYYGGYENLQKIISDGKINKDEAKEQLKNTTDAYISLLILLQIELTGVKTRLLEISPKHKVLIGNICTDIETNKDDKYANVQNIRTNC